MKNDVDNTKVRKKTNSARTPSKRLSLLQKIRTHFRSYCNHTSIHGFQYFGQNRTIFEKCWWILVFICIIGCCTWAICLIYDKWQQSPVIVSLTTRETPIYLVPFPAVTICPTIRFSKECMHYAQLIKNVTVGILGRHNIKKLDENQRNLIHYLIPLCRKNLRFMDLLDEENISDEIFEAIKKCSPFVSGQEISARFMDEYLSFNDSFRPTYTEDGLCFSFNMVSADDILRNATELNRNSSESDPKSSWIPQFGYSLDAELNTFPRRALLAGAANSLEIKLKHRKRDIDYMCTGAAQGYKVILHLPTRVPRPTLEYNMAPFGKATTISVAPHMMTTSNVVKTYDAKKRDCYFEGEKYLQFFKIYSKVNCDFECLTNYTLRECGCVPFHMPRESSTPICGITMQPCVLFTMQKYNLMKLRSQLKESKMNGGLMRSSTPRIMLEEDIVLNLTFPEVNETENVNSRKKRQLDSFDEDEEEEEEEARCSCLRSCNDITYKGSATTTDYNWRETKFDGNSTESYGCWWTLVFLCCVGGCTYMIYEVCTKWIETPVLVSLATKDTAIHKVPFPAVTICPESKISRSCVNYSKVLRMRKAGQGHLVPPLESEYFDNMALLCKSSNYENTTDNDPLNDYSEFLDKCKSVTLDNSHCKFMNVEVSCKNILQPIITDEGLCYSFNMFNVRDIYADLNRMEYFPTDFPDPTWDVDDGYPNDVPSQEDYPLRVLGSGNKNSLVVVLLTKKSNVYYSCRDFSLQGMRVTLHMPARIPRPNQVFFPVGLNELVYAQVTPTLMGTTTKIRDYEPSKRNCYFGKERKLKYFKIYTQSNCNLECWTNYTIQECGCVHYYMPRDSNTSICPIGKRSCLQTASETYAVSDFPQQYHRNQTSKGNLTADCDCLPICSDLNYNAETSRGKWNWDDPNGANVGDLKKYFVDHYASAVKISFKGTFFLPTEKSELYGIVDFLSNTGGILGLFTGFSLVSLVEIIYFLSIKLIANYKKYGYWAGEREE